MSFPLPYISFSPAFGIAYIRSEKKRLPFVQLNKRLQKQTVPNAIAKLQSQQAFLMRTQAHAH